MVRIDARNLAWVAFLALTHTTQALKSASTRVVILNPLWSFKQCFMNLTFLTSPVKKRHQNERVNMTQARLT